MQRYYRNEYHERNEDEYEDDGYDDYEEEGFEGEEEDEQEEEKDQKPSAEQLEFLKIREQLKEKFRQEMKKESANDFGHSIQSQDRKRASTNDKFGSFFGPSQPVIASRVIDESRSIRETQHIISKSPNFSGHERASPLESSQKKLESSQKKIHEHHPRPTVNEVKRKAQTLKDMRDYSFLQSDDTDLPDNKEPPPASRHVSAPKPDARSSQPPLKSNIHPSRPLKPVSNGHDLKNAVSTSRQLQAKVPMKGGHGSRLPPSPSAPRRLPESNVGGNGPGRPAGPRPLPKPIPSKVPVKSTGPVKSQSTVQVMGTNKPSAKAMSAVSSKNNISTAKPPPTHNHYAEMRVSQAADRVRATTKPPPPMKTQPPKTIPSRDIRGQHLKKKPVKRRSDEDADSDADEAIQMIRNMFRYNPSKYAAMDADDDSDMEAGFSQIQEEELRSAQIARAEDDEELRLIEEEERRERMRKKQKLMRR